MGTASGHRRRRSDYNLEGKYMKKILFSAVGGHDPVASYHDGAILHICRKYKPDQVYLYYSKEMIGRKRQDNRYEKALELLQEELNFKIEKIVAIEKEELEDVHKFDSFYIEFEDILNNILSENADCELMVNLSSGTPAIKNALNIVAVLSRTKIKAIQVSTPNLSENPKEDNPQKYDLETFWELNEDRKIDVTDRCVELENLNLLTKIKKEVIIKMLNAYDYNGALLVAEDIEVYLSDEAMKLLRFARHRAMLDESSMSKLNIGDKIYTVPIRDGGKRKIFEYLLWLQLKQEKGDYADFIRGITPVVFALFEECLKKYEKIDLKNYCREGNDGVYRLDNNKFDQSEKGRKYKLAICECLNVNELSRVAYSEKHIMAILRYSCNNPELILKLEEIIEIEKNARHIAAHQIVSVTDEWIKKRTNFTSKQILNKLENIAIQSGISIQKELWNSYNEMNGKIIELITKM